MGTCGRPSRAPRGLSPRPYRGQGGVSWRETGARCPRRRRPTDARALALAAAPFPGKKACFRRHHVHGRHTPAPTRFRGWDSDPPRAVLHRSPTKAPLRPGALAPLTPHPSNSPSSGAHLRRGVSPVSRVLPRGVRGRTAPGYRANGRCRARDRQAPGIDAPGEAPGCVGHAPWPAAGRHPSRHHASARLRDTEARIAVLTWRRASWPHHHIPEAEPQEER
jgi:hypothetical protein